ncbi:hypothetical protein LA080_012392 [Diaporthe eres]|uniref:Uncharacterized protein n=1 Tax=Diaporthe vaccinii TaxID=105482 RepID=A0ABR4ELH7_9PEZI|nr:hypothetical protein LA080_012392 [Diaporthe eres]
MFSPRILVAIFAFASATLAADNSTCWKGNIGDPCYGHQNGCALTGAMLVCAQASTGIDEMIFYDACYPPKVKARTDDSHGTCRCLPDGESDCAI